MKKERIFTKQIVALVIVFVALLWANRIVGKEEPIGIIVGGEVCQFMSEEEYYYEKELEQRLRYLNYEEEGVGTTVTVTKYNPTKEQCDGDPLITADNSKICLDKLNSGELRWIAVSRDLRSTFKYGEVVIITSPYPEINGEWIVRDTMNPRWKNRVDLLRPIGDTKGKWEGVKIRKKRV